MPRRSAPLGAERSLDRLGFLETGVSAARGHPGFAEGESINGLARAADADTDAPGGRVGP
ncbi:hypothetical protein MILUP08_41279 [Micromonospora lupini str. Lupac 08]|uniref:Uncharacterized protein n=1 Tax=Micromonospora lupini str. Lupac 08 TaxID=1150864 RepID=I0KXR8_9ACTN|nr:hypothetical protein MILUP08_41279 [Micromonospora lupini str. Lupac 08]